MRGWRLLFAGCSEHFAQFAQIALNHGKLVEASARLFRQFELFDRRVQVALHGVVASYAWIVESATTSVHGLILAKVEARTSLARSVS